jgi:hypothetical protein
LKITAQAMAVDILTALVSLIRQQIAYFAILKSRSQPERKIGYSLWSIATNLCSESFEDIDHSDPGAI